MAEFEQAYARFLGAGNCVGVANGTDALELALRASGVTAGAEVILPANTFIATAEAVSRIGARAGARRRRPGVPADRPGPVAEAVTPRTQAIMPVHLFGQTAFVERLAPIAAACGAVIVEDAAQSQGASRHGRFAGTLGLAAGTSFYPGKNLGAAGDAGAVVTDDDDVAARVRHAGRPRQRTEIPARRGRHELAPRHRPGGGAQRQAAQAGRRGTKRRRRPRHATRRCWRTCPGVELPRAAPGNLDVWHLYVIRVPDRDRVLAALNEAGYRRRHPLPRSGAPQPRLPGSGPRPRILPGRGAGRPAGSCRCRSSRTSARRSSSTWRTGCRQPWAQKHRRRPRQGPGARHEQPGADRCLIASTNWDGVAGTDKRMVESLARSRPVLWVDPPTHATLKTVARLRGRPGIPAARTGQPDWNGYPNSILRLRVTVLPGVTRPGIRRLTALFAGTGHHLRPVADRLGARCRRRRHAAGPLPPKDAGNQDPVPDRPLA